MDHKLTAFEMRVWKEIRRLESMLTLKSPDGRTGQRLSGSKVLVAVSGGQDSIVLLELCRRLQSRLRIEIVVAHVHHGHEWDSSSGQWQKSGIRDQFCRHVQLLAGERGFEFFTNVPFDGGKFDWAEFYGQNMKLKSEADFRLRRMKLLNQMRAQSQTDWILFAHHNDDLFETRVIRLLRGTGPEGLMAMRSFYGRKCRPLLYFSRKELAAYAKARQLKWVEDPSNQDPGPMRNWLRNRWLPMLEKKRRGSTEAFARSLETLVDVWQMRVPQLDFVRLEPGVLHRGAFMVLDSVQQLVILAHALLELNARSFNKQQLVEVQKRLSSEQREFQFEVAGAQWCINAQQIVIIPKMEKALHAATIKEKSKAGRKPG